MTLHLSMDVQAIVNVGRSLVDWFSGALSAASVTTLVGLVAAWGAGVLSNEAAAQVRNRFRAPQIRKAVLSELLEVRALLALATYVLNVDPQEATSDDLLNWIHTTLKDEKDPELVNGLKGLQQLRSLPPEHRIAWVKQNRGANTGKTVKEYDLPFLHELATELSILPIPFLREVFSVKLQLAIYNQEARRLQEYFKMTFDSSLSEESNLVMRRDMNVGYIALSKRARQIAEKITALNVKWAT
jgi:hypothetical protein